MQTNTEFMSAGLYIDDVVLSKYNKLFYYFCENELYAYIFAFMEMHFAL